MNSGLFCTNFNSLCVRLANTNSNFNLKCTVRLEHNEHHFAFDNETQSSESTSFWPVYQIVNSPGVLVSFCSADRASSREMENKIISTKYVSFTFRKESFLLTLNLIKPHFGVFNALH